MPVLGLGLSCTELSWSGVNVGAVQGLWLNLGLFWDWVGVGLIVRIVSGLSRIRIISVLSSGWDCLGAEHGSGIFLCGAWSLVGLESVKYLTLLATFG